MSFDRRRALALLAPGAALAAWLVLGALILRATLAPGQRAALAPLVASHGALVLGWWLAAAAIGAWAVGRLYQSHVAAPARLADATRLLVDDPAAPALAPAGSAPSATWPRPSTGSPTSGGRFAPTWRGWSRTPAARWRSSATSSGR